MSTHVSPSLCGGRGVNPALVLPEGCDVVVVPALLLAEGTGQAVGSVNGLGVAVVIALSSQCRLCMASIRSVPRAGKIGPEM